MDLTCLDDWIYIYLIEQGVQYKGRHQMFGTKEIIRKFDENNYIVEFNWQDGTFNYSAVINNVQSAYMHNDAMEAYNELVKAGA